MTEHHAHEPNEFFATYRPTTSVMHEAREAFSTWLEQAAPGSGLGEEMAVVLSELLPTPSPPASTTTAPWPSGPGSMASSRSR
jgi:hypothetical protein